MKSKTVQVLFQCFLLALAGVVGAEFADVEHKRSHPGWPESYEVHYNFTLPYMKRIQRDGLSYSVRFLKDVSNQRMLIDTFDGADLTVYSKGVEYQLYPRIDKQVCDVWQHESGDDLMAHQVLPDLSEWEYVGTEQLHGKSAAVWMYDAYKGEKHLVHRMYTTLDGQVPLRWHEHGQDQISGAHFDEWILDYVHYKPGVPDASSFDPPQHCSGVKPQPAGGPTGHAYRMAELCPATRFNRDLEYDAFAAEHGRLHSSEQEYEMRKQVFYSNKQLVEEWNAQPGAGFTMAINKFADWTQDEFEAVMLPKRAARRSGQRKASLGGMVPRSRKHQLAHEPRVVDSSRLPSEVDWAGTPAEGPVAVKDQATCGSCWAFGAVGAVTGAYYMERGASVDFSQQQMVDCSWDFGNDGCDGGFHDQALEYVIEAGGLAPLADYEYAGQDLYCGANRSNHRMTDLKGYVMLPEGDALAVKEAVYSRGPLAVAIDAGHPSFRFYSSGVYYEPECSWQEDDLDHAVTLVGYGTDDDMGEGYWKIRNSWSQFWGDDGYVRISQRGHSCGVTTQAMYAVMEPAAADAESAASVA